MNLRNKLHNNIYNKSIKRITSWCVKIVKIINDIICDNLESINNETYSLIIKTDF
jgi:hypothetical protein